MASSSASNRCAYRVSASSPPRRTSFTIFATRFSVAASRARPGVRSARTDRRLSESTMVSMHSDHNLVERILHDALAPRRFHLRDQIADRAFLDDRIDGDPVGIAQRRDRRSLKRGKQRQHFLEIETPYIQHETHAALCLDGGAEQQRDILDLGTLPLVRER